MSVKIKIIHISQKGCYSDLKNLCLSKQYGAKRLLSELADNGRKLRSIDSLLKRIRKTGAVVWQPSSGRLRLAHSSGGPCAQSGGQAKKAPISL